MQDLVYKILPRQRMFMEWCQRVPFSAYIGGFGSGKTHTLNLQVLVEAQQPSFGLVGAKTYRMLSDTTQRKFFELCPPQWITSFMKSENKVKLVNGSEILFRALDEPQKLTNLEVDWFGLDEVGEVKLDTFRMLQGRLRKLGGSHHGFCVGNPAGPTHWTYEYFVIKAQTYPDTYHLVQATSYENTFLAKSYTEEMEKSFGKDSFYYKRFVLGQFVAFEGAYWPHFSVLPYPEGHVLGVNELSKVLQPGNWFYGKVIDFGYEHPFVCLWYITDGHTIVFYDEYVRRHGLIKEHCRAIKDKELEHFQSFKFPPPTYALTDHDATARAEISSCKVDDEYLGFPCKIEGKEVMEGIWLVQTLITQGRFFITDRCTNTRLELPSYRSKAIDRSTKEEPLKEQDDTCDCVRMACQHHFSGIAEFRRYDKSTYTVGDDIWDLKFDG